MSDMKNIDATTRLMMHSGISSAGVVPDELMNSHELCDFLKITPQQMYVCRRKYALPCFKPTGKLLYFRRSEVERWLEARRCLL
jgi:predicted DNA-binding transcriptional regulator AlpA